MYHPKETSAQPQRRRFENPKFRGNDDRTNLERTKNADPFAPKKQGWLFLRRYPGERVAVIHEHGYIWVELVDIDPEAEQARLRVTGMDEPLVLRRFEDAAILQGDCMLRLNRIEEYDAPRHTLISLGILAPRNIAVRREELIRGLSEEKIRALAAPLHR